MVDYDDDDVFELIEEPEPVTYACPVCLWETQSTVDLAIHHGEKHAVKETFMLGKSAASGTIELYRFESEADYKAWIAFVEAGEISRRYFRARPWESPGWYGTLSEEEPCRRGCCRDWVERVYTVQELAKRFAHETEEAAKTLDAFRNITTTLNKLSGPPPG